MSKSIVTLALIIVAATACTAAPASTATLGSRATPDITPGPASAPLASAPMTPPPTPMPETLPADLDPKLADAIRLRRSYGLRSDLDYVRLVANDPRASNDAYGVPVYPEEFTDVQNRFEVSRQVAGIVRGYADWHRDEFGGLYIDESTRAGVVSLWTANVAEHAGAIRALAGRHARLAFGQVRYSEVDLRILQDRITNDIVGATWLANIPASLRRVGVDIHASQVVVGISSANPDAADIVEAHFDVGDQLRVESDGTGADLIPWGTVKGRVVPIDNVNLSDVTLDWASDDPGDCGGGDMGFGVREGGRFELPCQVGRRTIMVLHVGPDGIDGELGRGTVTVLEGKTVKLTIRLNR